MNIKLVKGLGIAATILAAGANVVATIAGKKEQDVKITEECAKAVAEALGNKGN